MLGQIKISWPIPIGQRHKKLSTSESKLNFREAKAALSLVNILLILMLFLNKKNFLAQQNTSMYLILFHLDVLHILNLSKFEFVLNIASYLQRRQSANIKLRLLLVHLMMSHWIPSKYFNTLYEYRVLEEGSFYCVKVA